MHRRILLIAALIALITLETGAQTYSLRVGEILTYKIYIAGLALGEERLVIKDGGQKNGRAFLQLVQSLDSYKTVFGLVDYHEQRTVVWDVAAGVPVLEEAAVVQRQAKQSERLVLDHERENITINRTHADGKEDTRTMPLARGTQTGATLLYYLRSFPWERGERRLPLLGGKGTEWYDFQITEEKNSLTVPFGRFERPFHLANPALKYDVWFDRGPGHLPLEIKSQRGAGKAEARLIDASGYN